MSVPPIDLALVPQGVVVLRDARTGSVREVPLEPFKIARTLTTAGLWDAIRTVSADADTTAPPLPTARTHPTTPTCPVTWFDAVRWCNSASLVTGLAPAYAISGEEVEWDTASPGYRLPTEAEWEWACRAGTTGPAYGPLEAIAWTDADKVPGPQPVATKEPNAYGLFDMLGNLWEWCWDYADPARYGAYRTLRGGGWADRSWSCRVSVRRGSAPDAVLEDVGFRVARGPVGEPGTRAAQGWSAEADERRGRVTGPLPVGWTPLGRRR